MGFGEFASLTLADVLISAVVVGVMFFAMSHALAQRLSLTTTTVMHRAYAHSSWVPAYIVKLFADYTHGRMGIWEKFWVVRHRDHHGDTDGPTDPHSPWNIRDMSIADSTACFKEAVRRLVGGHNLVMYRDVDDPVAYVRAHKTAIRTTFLDDWFQKWPKFGPVLSVHIMGWATHLIPYLAVGWLLNQVGVNPVLYLWASLGVAIGSFANGGAIYTKLSARVNGYGHAFPIRSKNQAIGLGSNYKRQTWFASGELLQAYHHFRQRSARIRMVEGTTWRDDIGYEIIRVLKLLRLGKDVNVIDDKPMPDGLRFIDENLDPIPDEVMLAA